MSDPKVSVVVPTRDRPERLVRSLAALATRPAAEALDVVVVDDGSRERAAVEFAAATFPGARLVRAEGGGPAAARNLGARTASGAVVCFLDDDCGPTGDWPGPLIAHADEHGAAAGLTVAPEGASRVVRAAQAITNHLQLSSLENGRLAFAPTSNLAVRREVMLRLPFDESFPFAAGEDREWCARALAEGVEIAFAPEAVVVHRPALDLAGFWRQQYRYGRGAARFRAATKRTLAPPAFYLGLAREGFRAGAGTGAAVIAAQLATAAGIAAERLSRG